MARVVTKEVIKLALLFAAARWNAIGTKRTYPRRLLFVRCRGEADIPHGPPAWLEDALRSHF
jgi:hypothetical protein